MMAKATSSIRTALPTPTEEGVHVHQRSCLNATVCSADFIVAEPETDAACASHTCALNLPGCLRRFAAAWQNFPVPNGSSARSFSGPPAENQRLHYWRTPRAGRRLL